METCEPMVAFRGGPIVKEFYRAQLQAHYDAGQIEQGHIWGGGTGCAIGCTLHSSDHTLFPAMFGIPEPIAWLVSGIFERLNEAEAEEFPLRFWDAIPVGADLSLVVPRFFVWLLVDPQHGAYRNVTTTAEERAAIQQIADLYERMIAGGEVERAEWERARSRAADASYARGIYPAYGNAEAGRVAAYGATATCSRTDACRMRDKLIALIKETAS